MTRIHRPRRRAVLVSTLALAAAGARAQSTDFPTKPITLVVPFAPGGSTDVTARRVAEEMQKTLRTSVVIQNKPGAGSFVATTQVTKSPKDGYTLFFAGSGILTLNPHIFRNLPYTSPSGSPAPWASRRFSCPTREPRSRRSI